MTAPGAPLGVSLLGSKVGQIQRGEKGYQLTYEPGIAGSIRL